MDGTTPTRGRTVEGIGISRGMPPLQGSDLSPTAGTDRMPPFDASEILDAEWFESENEVVAAAARLGSQHDLPAFTDDDDGDDEQDETHDTRITALPFE